MKFVKVRIVNLDNNDIYDVFRMDAETETEKKQLGSGSKGKFVIFLDGKTQQAHDLHEMEDMIELYGHKINNWS